MVLRVLVAFLGLIVWSGFAFATDYADREDVQHFVDQLCRTDGFSKDELMRVFSKTNYKQQVVDAISRPAEKVLKWDEYQDIFLTRKRVVEGGRFLMNNSAALIEARNRYGVPPAIVAAIIGVETMYGRQRGRFRVIDALSTLAFDYPPRAEFFRYQLREFLLLTREEHRSPTQPLGSYAGAMGYGQFMPSSFRQYAVDLDGDGVRDIWNDRADAIGSVANYLAQHGWRPGELVTVRASRPRAKGDKVFSDSLEPTRTIGELKSVGVLSDVSMQDDTKVAPLLFEGKRGPEYWLALRNFYVITRYNHSKLYAMAVFQLSERLKKLTATADTTDF